MKRKYPVSFFLLGILHNLIRYLLIGIIGLVLLVIGFFGVNICKIIGAIVIICYFLQCIIEQFFIRSTILKESDNPEFNNFMDNAFGNNDYDKNTFSSSEKIIKMVEDKIKSENIDSDN